MSSVFQASFNAALSTPPVQQTGVGKLFVQSPATGQQIFFWPAEPVPLLQTVNNPDPETANILVRKDEITLPDAFVSSLEDRFPDKKVIYFEQLEVAQINDLDLNDLEKFFEPQLQTFSFVEFDNVATTTKTSESYALGRITTLGSLGSSPWEVNPPNTGSGVTCFVIDSGLNTQHPDVVGRATRGESFISGQTWDQDFLGHGTSVTSMVSGTTAGIADDVTIVPYKVFGSTPETQTSTILGAMNFLLANEGNLGGSVINCSFGGPRDFTMDLAVQSMRDRGATVVAAAGNNNGNAINYSPGASVDCITVGATTSSDSKASFSNFGERVNIWAPGQSVLAATGNSGFSNISGTSFSSPLVAGAACILLNAQPTLSFSQIQQALINASQKDQFTGDVNNNLLYCGPGFIDRAFSEPVEPPVDPPVDPVPPPIDPEDPVTPPGSDPDESGMESSSSADNEYVSAAIITSVIVAVLILIYVLLRMML